MPDDEADLNSFSGSASPGPGRMSEAERAPFIDAGLEPWVEGVPAHFIRVNPTSIWGNRTRRA
jgi:hypothetical protein